MPIMDSPSVTQIDGGSTAAGGSYVTVAASDAPADLLLSADFVCDGTADEVQIQAALDALPATGGAVTLSPGTFSLSDTVVINKGNATLDGAGSVLSAAAALAGSPMVKVLNSDYCRITDGIQFAGNWRSGTSALDVVGSIGGSFTIRGDELWYGLRCLATAAAGATRNVGMNTLDMIVRNGVNGMVFEGDGTHFAANNDIRKISWWGAQSVAGVGMDFVAYADNNITTGAFLQPGVSTAIGVRFNQSAPTAENGVYENHWSGIIEGETSGLVAIKGNRTDTAIGERPTRVSCRLGGATPATYDIAADCDVIFTQKTAEPTSIIFGAGEMNGAGGSPSLTNANRWNIYNLDATTQEWVSRFVDIPYGWATFDVVLLWANGSSGSGDVSWIGHVSTSMAAGDSIAAPSGGSAVTATAGTQNVLIETTLLSGVAKSTRGPVYIAITRDATNAADTLANDAGVVAVILNQSS